MKQTYFLTGYPGFLARNLVEQLFQDNNDDIEHVYFLVLPAERANAANTLKQFIKTNSCREDKFSIVIGDITLPTLGINATVNRELQENVTHVFHLAAIYDLAVEKELAWKVNVGGTRNLVNWLKTLGSLERFVYFSTAYVSGTREGKIYEDELIMDQKFKNHYEQTKYEAEVIVRKNMGELPTTVIRPAIVKGHSTTGFTTKFDGLYFMLNMFRRLKHIPSLPYIDKRDAEGNFVPYDYVIQATSYLAIDPIGLNKTYHLTDPHPYTMREIYDMMAEKYLHKRPQGTLPADLSGIFLNWGLMRKWLGIEREALDYFTTASSYDTYQAQEDLEGTGITCPDLKDQLDSMIAFYNRYQDDYEKHISIK